MLQTEVASREEVIEEAETLTVTEAVSVALGTEVAAEAKAEEETVKVAPRRTKVQTRCIKKTKIQSKFFIFLQFCIVKFGKIDALYCPGKLKMNLLELFENKKMHLEKVRKNPV